MFALSPPSALPLPDRAPRRVQAPSDRAPRFDEAACRALVEQVRAGDVEAFDQLYRATRDDVARILFHLVGASSAELEDLLQDTYLQLLPAVQRFRGDATFRTFLFRICANVAASRWRWRRRRPEELFAELPERPCPQATPEQSAEAAQAQRLVHAALEALSTRKRIVFVYHQLWGMRPEEISEATGVGVNTVRSRLHHARLEFQDALDRLVTPRKGRP